jgi:hypothetical protein
VYISKLALVIIACYIAFISGQTYLRGRLREEIILNLQAYDTYIGNEKTYLYRMGRDNDGGYVVPNVALARSDALLGYGIADDASFEESFSKIYNKPSYGFDCSCKRVVSTNDLFTFIPECIGTTDFVYKNSNASKNVTSFKTQIDNLKLTNKPVFIKMDIEGAEFKTLPEILAQSQNVTGIVLELHFNKRILKLWKSLQLVKQLNKDFFLVHFHTNNYVKAEFKTKNISKGDKAEFKTKNISKGNIGSVIELTYINKSLVSKATKISDMDFPTALDQPNCITCEEHIYSMHFDN